MDRLNNIQAKTHFIFRSVQKTKEAQALEVQAKTL